MSLRLQRVHSVSLRIALMTVAIVAAVYLVISIIVVAISTRNLTGEIDARLHASLHRLGTPAVRRIGPEALPPPLSGPRFGPPLLVWHVLPDGSVASNDAAAELPGSSRYTVDPETISVGDTDVRIAGTDVNGSHWLVGQTMDSVARARSNLLRAELIVAPILLGAVFLGALAIARRAALPFELARQRQMEFTADASHELRTPLAVIEAQTSLALAQDRAVDWYRSAFRRVGHESGRIRRLVEDLLWLARFDATRGQPHAEPVDLGALVRQAADRFGGVAEARRLTLTVRAGEGQHVIIAPPEWLDRLLGVLLDNACKYSPEGGAVEALVGSDGAGVRLTIDDSGPGIPDHERTRIFDRFHRATAAGNGAGLGLAIADAVVQATGGRWQVGACPLGGARMSVVWPRADPRG